MESNLKLYSLGIVVEDKPEGTDYALISPVESLNIQPAGDIKEYSKKAEGTIKNVNDKNFKTELQASNYLRAKWLPFGHSNRITAPDLYKNETVILFKYENVDEYYWTTIFREVELRRLETVLYGYSNLKSGMEAFDKSTSYWTEIDTRRKTIKLHTSMNDGEFTEYDVLIDAKNGRLIITDKLKNYIQIDSKKDDITVNTNKTVNVTAGQTVNVKGGNTVNIEGSSSVNIKATTINITGNVNVNGNINATGSIMDTGGNSNHHSH